MSGVIGTRQEGADLASTQSTTVDRDLLSELIGEDGIRCVSQPIVDLYTGEIFGHELLARGTGNIRMPEALFRRAAELGLCEVLERSCRDAALERAAELSAIHPNLNHFINISPDSIDDPHIRRSFEPDELRSRGIEPRSLVLEITETASVDNYVHFEEIMRYYVEKGLRIALDDFGSGHSGLITLVAVTPHFMKIDKAIVRSIHTSSYRQKLVRAIASFAGQAGSELIAEGVETWDELHTLFRLGVRYVQGYLLAMPSEHPGTLSEGVRNELRSLIIEYHHKQYSVDLSIAGLIIMPHLIGVRTASGADIDRMFKRNNTITHAVLVDRGRPVGLITRQQFYSVIGSQYGYSVYSKRFIDSIAKTEMLIVDERTDLRALGRLAMARRLSELYDPVVVVNASGNIIGTITMRQLLKNSFDTEIKLATSANPLTGLPGNMAIGEWLENVIKEPYYCIAYADLDRFKEFNDCYGFAAGDDMIRLVAKLLCEYAEQSTPPMKLGHVGGDDFVIVCDTPVEPAVAQRICTDFDEVKKDLFSPADLDRGFYTSVNRKGETVDTPLVTLSLAIITSANYRTRPHPGELAQNVASLKRRIKARNAETGKSGYIFERRRIDIHSAKPEGGSLDLTSG